MIELKNLTKIYKMGEGEVRALDDLTLTISQGEFVAIMGPSGSGKSTLAQIIGLLDRPTSGSYKLSNLDVTKTNDDRLAVIRREGIGFIFQQFNLLSRNTSQSNIELPLLYSKKTVATNHVAKLLEMVGLSDRASHRSSQLSGGQQQRVAIARSLVNSPKVIIADEPTGNLDSKSEQEILKILHELNGQGITIIMITHEEEIGKEAKRLIRMRDGKIISDVTRENSSLINAISPIKVKESRFQISDLFTYFNVGLKTLLANKIRSSLSMLGILIGVASVVAILALGKGASISLEAQLSTLGSNILVVRSGMRRSAGILTESAQRQALYLDDLTFLKERLPEIRDGAPSIEGGTSLIFKDKNWRTSILGTTLNYFDLRNWKVEAGRLFTKAEDESKSRVCLIGRTILRELFNYQNPIGEEIRINKIPFTVIGIMAERSGGGFRDQNDVVVMPLQTAMKRVVGKDSVDGFDLTTYKMEDVTKIEPIVVDLLVKKKNIPISQRDNAIMTMNLADIQKTIGESNKTMSMLLSSVAAISLLVGGIGIMNIMLVSVTERTREIGLRKAIGARSIDIMIQFLMEAVVLTLCGGLLGILIGGGITLLLSTLAGWTTAITLDSILLAVLFSTLIGVIFGIYPARRASKLSPIEALRYE